jgi:hypothetical protein
LCPRRRGGMERSVTLMSLTLVIAVNGCLDVAILGALAFVMTRAGGLSRHRQLGPTARAERQPRVAPRTRPSHRETAPGRTASARH